MLENRSFDHMLGFMAGPGYPIDGLSGTESCPVSANDPTPVRVASDASAGLPFDVGRKLLRQADSFSETVPLLELLREFRFVAHERRKGLITPLIVMVML